MDMQVTTRWMAAPERAGEIGLLGQFIAVRTHSDRLAAALSAEDQALQSMPDASPAKWHLAHTTWFFEHFVLCATLPDYQIFDPVFGFLFNSYYEAVGPRQARGARGMITRPDAARVRDYRAYVDRAMQDLLASAGSDVTELVTLGLNHEQQHQELLITDITHAFSQNPLLPAAIPGWALPIDDGDDAREEWVSFDGGLIEIGHRGEEFHFDNETPRHKVWLEPYRLARSVVRCGLMRDFIADGGYQTPSLWMADGWALVQAEDWRAPLYWRQLDGQWHGFGPGGAALVDPRAPLAHISWYEADALARWAGKLGSGARLPSEAEWEAACGDPRLRAMTGSVWQWTESAYRPYPGFRPVTGAIGEYNGKFMINQMVLRGGSAATPAGHQRASYRNFFHPDKRWQFSGLRLAQDY